MHHAAAENFHPLFALANFNGRAHAFIANIHFGRWFCKWEVMRAELDIDICFEKGGYKIHQHTFEVAHVNAFVDNQAFDLMEHWRMCLVTIAAISSSRRDDTDRRLFIYHGADLHRRSVSTKNFLFLALRRGHEEGIMHVTGRMSGRKV